MSKSLVRVERQGPRERLGVEDRGASSAVPVVRHDVEVIGFGLDDHTGGCEIVALVPTRQKHLTNRYPVLVEYQHTALAVHRHVEVTVAVGAHRVGCRAGEMVGDGRPNGAIAV